MNRWLGVSLSFAAVLAAGACDQFGLGPKHAESAPVAPEAPDLTGYVGRDYAALASALPQYGPAGLGLSEADTVRLAQVMVETAPAWTAAGGGAEALVFTGCAAEGCDVGRGVVAIDLATGAPFVGVSDAQGLAELSVNDRVEALLRLSAPSGRWDASQPAEAAEP